MLPRSLSEVNLESAYIRRTKQYGFDSLAGIQSPNLYRLEAHSISSTIAILTTPNAIDSGKTRYKKILGITSRGFAITTDKFE